jgi:NAD(P)-dependent dehydrogenase (short-subunit alcohol dehydrogenase family)
MVSVIHFRTSRLAAVAYLASDEAGWITGTVLHVNGGMAMLG